MDPITILGVIAGILGTAATVITFYLKRKQDTKEDADAMATVEADELAAGMDRVDALDRQRVQQPVKKGPH